MFEKLISHLQEKKIPSANMSDVLEAEFDFIPLQIFPQSDLVVSCKSKHSHINPPPCPMKAEHTHYFHC